MEGPTPSARLASCSSLSPTMLPWYVSWGMALLVMTAWTPRGLAYVVFGSVWLLVVCYPDGETALYNWPYLAVCALLAGLAAVSLLRPDPLHLAAAASAPASPRREPARARRTRRRCERCRAPGG